MRWRSKPGGCAPRRESKPRVPTPAGRGHLQRRPRSAKARLAASSAGIWPAGSCPSPPETRWPAGSRCAWQGHPINWRRPAETGRWVSREGPKLLQEARGLLPASSAPAPTPDSAPEGPPGRPCPQNTAEGPEEAHLYRRHRLSRFPRRHARTRAPARAPDHVAHPQAAAPPGKSSGAHARARLRPARPTLPLRPGPPGRPHGDLGPRARPPPRPRPPFPAKRGLRAPRSDRNPNRRSAPASPQGLRRPGRSGRRGLPGARLGTQILPGMTTPAGPETTGPGRGDPRASPRAPRGRPGPGTTAGSAPGFGEAARGSPRPGTAGSPRRAPGVRHPRPLQSPRPRPHPRRAGRSPAPQPTSAPSSASASTTSRGAAMSPPSALSPPPTAARGAIRSRESAGRALAGRRRGAGTRTARRPPPAPPRTRADARTHVRTRRSERAPAAAHVTHGPRTPPSWGRGCVARKRGRRQRRAPPPFLPPRRV